MGGACLKLTSLTVKGFRSLGDVTIQLTNYNSLIGQNDAGKSSFLRALQLLFDPSEIPSEQDRCTIPLGHGDYYIEGVLGDAGSHPLASQGEIKIRRDLGSRRFSIWGDTPESVTLSRVMIGSITKGEFEKAADVPTDVKEFIKGELPDRVAPPEAWKDAFKKAAAKFTVKYKIGWKPVEDQEIPKLVQPILLKADVRAEEEMGDGPKSTNTKLGCLLLQQAAKNHPGIAEALAKLTQEVASFSEREDGKWKVDELNRMEAILQEELNRFDDDVEIESQLAAPKAPTISPFTMKLAAHDDCTQSMSNMGHGLRRSVVFAMLCTLSRMSEIVQPNPDAPTPLYLFLIEEPEIYLHPQAERKRNRDLHRLSKLPTCQVVLCTHSAFFVELADYKGITRLYRQSRGPTQAFRWSGAELDPASTKTLQTTRFFHPTRAAMLFADLVILSEGESESVTVPPVAEREGLPVDGVEFVQCAGNGSLPIYQRVLSEFGIRHVVWLDSKEKTEVEAARNVLGTYGKLVLTDRNWEHMTGVSASGKGKVFNSWSKFVDKEERPNEKTMARIHAAYHWEPYETDPKEEQP